MSPTLRTQRRIHTVVTAIEKEVAPAGFGPTLPTCLQSGSLSQLLTSVDLP
jgi:hypothetical protein